MHAKPVLATDWSLRQRTWPFLEISSPEGWAGRGDGSVVKARVMQAGRPEFGSPESMYMLDGVVSPGIPAWEADGLSPEQAGW